MIPLGNRYFLPFSQNIIIRVNARALIYFWYLKGGRNRALVSFLILIWLGIRKTGKRTYCLWILPGCNDQPSNRRKILRRDLSFEGTVHSWRHDSSETGAINGRWTKIDKRNTICKFNQTWSQRNLPNFMGKNEWPAKSPVLNQCKISGHYWQGSGPKNNRNLKKKTTTATRKQKKQNI